MLAFCHRHFDFVSSGFFARRICVSTTSATLNEVAFDMNLAQWAIPGSHGACYEKSQADYVLRPNNALRMT